MDLSDACVAVVKVGIFPIYSIAFGELIAASKIILRSCFEFRASTMSMTASLLTLAVSPAEASVAIAFRS